MIPGMDKAAIGERIRGLRLARGLTLREAAPLCGVKFSTLGQIENGTINTTLDTLEAIVTGLGANVSVELTPGPAIPAERRAVLNRFATVLPYVPDDHLDVFLAELALWERRYAPRSSPT